MLSEIEAITITVMVKTMIVDTVLFMRSSLAKFLDFQALYLLISLFIYF
jgi:hypothetical protein